MSSNNWSSSDFLDVLARYANLRTFNCDNDELSRIESRTFANNSRLEILILSHNWITTLDDDAFVGKSFLLAWHRGKGSNRINYGGRSFEVGVMELKVFVRIRNRKKDTPLQIPACFAKKAIETLQCKKSQIFE